MTESAMRVTIELPQMSDFLHCLADTKDFNDYSGVYLLYNKMNVLIYVGKAKSIGERLRAHWNGWTHTKQFSQQIEYAQVYIFDNPIDREIVETYLINTLYPKYNQAKVYEDYDVVGKRNATREHKKRTKTANMTDEWTEQTNMLSKPELEQYYRWCEIKGYTEREEAIA